jgi:hypothetical protein
MISIFRKLRKKENRLTRYLLYAIGEIILIIIGIFCAVQLNNWNEGKKETKRIEALLDKYEEELYLTIGNADWDLKNGVHYDSLIQAILNDEVSIEDYWENVELEEMIDKAFTLDPADVKLRKVLELEETLPEKYEPHINRLKYVLFWINREEPYRRALWESSKQNREYLNLKYPWARKTDSLSRTEAFNYYVNNPEHKNRLWAHYHHINNYLREIYNYRKCAQLLLTDLKLHRDGYGPEQMDKFYKKLGLSPVMELACEEEPENERLYGGVSTLVTNMSSDTIQIVYFDEEDQLLRTNSTPPKSTRFTASQWKQGDDMPPRIIELKRGDNCEKRYIQRREGYLIVLD